MKLANNTSYYVRFRGRITGPFTLERLRNMAYAGQLSPLHEVSMDRSSWSAANAIPGLLPQGDTSAVSSPSAIPLPAPNQSPSERWYYLERDGSRVGPISRRKLMEMLDEGRIGRTTSVWTKGMPEWKTAAEAGLSAREEAPPMSPSRHSDRGPDRAPNSTRWRLGIVLGAIGAGVVGLIGVAIVIVLLVVLPSRKPETQPQPQPEGTVGQPLTGEQVYQHLVRGTVLIAHDKGLGTGFVVDTKKRLVVTNYHVVFGKDQVTVIFPMYDASGELITAAEKYRGRPSEIGITGDVLALDEHRDLALVRLIRVNRLPERTDALKLAERPATTGGRVYSVGSSGIEENLLWRLTPGNVRGRSHKKSTISNSKGTFQMQLDCMVLETDSPTNQGDSGGPVVNDRGELVGVVSNANTIQRSVSGFIDLEELREFLSRHTPGN